MIWSTRFIQTVSCITIINIWNTKIWVKANCMNFKILIWNKRLRSRNKLLRLRHNPLMTTHNFNLKNVWFILKTKANPVLIIFQIWKMQYLPKWLETRKVKLNRRHYSNTKVWMSKITKISRERNKLKSSKQLKLRTMILNKMKAKRLFRRNVTLWLSCTSNTWNQTGT